MKALTAASATLAIAVPAISEIAAARPIELAHHDAARRPCTKLFTIAMGKRAARAVYRGTRDVTLRNLRLLGRIEMCQRDPANQGLVRRFDRRRRHAWWVRRNPPPPSCTSQLASWYDDGGATASGYHAGMGVANKTLPFGTQVTFSYGGRSVTATVDDRGPYVGGRVWDLNQNVAGALGFDGVGAVCASVAG